MLVLFFALDLILQQRCVRLHGCWIAVVSLWNIIMHQIPNVLHPGRRLFSELAAVALA